MGLEASGRVHEVAAIAVGLDALGVSAAKTIAIVAVSAQPFL